MEYILFIGGILLVSHLFGRYFKYKSQKTLASRIKGEFGTVQQRDFVEEDIQYFMKFYADEADIDDITWNDLEMDKVFRRINRCNSAIGEQYLYRELHTTRKAHETKKVFLNLLEYFKENQEKRVKVQIKLAKLGREKANYFMPEFINELEDFMIKNMWVYRILSLTLLISIVLGIFLNHSFFFLSVLTFIVNAAMYTLAKFKYEIHLEMLSTIVGVISTSKTLIDMDFPMDTEEIEEVQESLTILRAAIKGIKFIKMKKEATVSGDVFAILLDYLIGSTLWDFHIFHKVMCTLNSKRQEFMKLAFFLGKIDSTISVLSYRESLTRFCTPEFDTEHKRIEFKGIYHPLIADPVCNPVEMTTSFIITGSNASGKSSYIKAIGINMILAQSIFTCLAEEALISYSDIMSSMAVRDDVSTGESYYMKEISYLKRIVAHVNDERMTLCLIDEILRGTNREERIAASVAILKYLHKKNCIVIVASHDVMISEILDSEYSNCHFSEVMGEKDVIFDYKVKAGVSRSTNAIRLLGRIGFPQEIVSQAELIVATL